MRTFSRSTRSSAIMLTSVLALVSLSPIFAGAGSFAYTYDALGRVVTVTNPNGSVVTYTYDAAGNRTQYVANTTPAVVATIGAGVFGGGTSSSNTFASNSVSVTGGSGSYSYTWTNTNDGGGTWNTGGVAASFAPSVSGVGTATNCISKATYWVMVTDNATHATVSSNSATYQWHYINRTCNTQ